MPPRLLILDFDGVIADSEAIANQALADYLTGIGHPTTLDDSIRMFMGRRPADTFASVERYIGRPVPDDFETSYRARTRKLMREVVAPVAGVGAFLDAHGHLAKCVASSSSREWLDHCVDKFGFRGSFGDRLFSSSLVANGKPAPDIFLHAAAAMATEPGAALVIEDSVAGVTGAVAAGMRVVGFLGGSHVRPGHRDQLLAAGAHHIAADFEEVAELVRGTG